MNIILNTLGNIRERGDICTDTLNHFMIMYAKFVRFYLLRKIHKRLRNVPGRSFISNCGYYTDNISSFLDFNLQLIAKKFKSYVKDTNDFLKRLCCLTNLPDNSLLQTMNVVGLYRNIPRTRNYLLSDKGLIKEMKNMYLLTVLLNQQNQF